MVAVGDRIRDPEKYHGRLVRVEAVRKNFLPADDWSHALKGPGGNKGPGGHVEVSGKGKLAGRDGDAVAFAGRFTRRSARSCRPRGPPPNCRRSDGRQRVTPSEVDRRARSAPVPNERRIGRESRSISASARRFPHAATVIILPTVAHSSVDRPSRDGPISNSPSRSGSTRISSRFQRRHVDHEAVLHVALRQSVVASVIFWIGITSTSLAIPFSAQKSSISWVSAMPPVPDPANCLRGRAC